MTRAGAALLFRRYASGHPETAPAAPGRGRAPVPATAGAPAGPDAASHASGPVEIRLGHHAMMILRLAADAERLSFDEAVARAIVVWAETVGMPKLLAADPAHGGETFDDQKCLTEVPRFSRGGERRSSSVLTPKAPDGAPAEAGDARSGLRPSAGDAFR